MPIPDGLALELLSPHHRRKRFASGNDKVDAWLHHRALAAMKKHTSTTRVLANDDAQIAGYYTLASTALDVSLVPVELVGGQLPTRPVPTVTLTWLGVDAAFARRGLGTYLFHQALADCVKAYEAIRYVAVLIDALDERNLAHHRAQGFAPVPGTTHKLFMPAATLLAAVSAPPSKT